MGIDAILRGEISSQSADRPGIVLYYFQNFEQHVDVANRAADLTSLGRRIGRKSVAVILFFPTMFRV